MSDDEKVRALRRIKEIRLFGNDHTELMAEAADLIESLQKQLTYEKARYDELQQYNVDCIKQAGQSLCEIIDLKEQLAESQRREKAIVDFLIDAERDFMECDKMFIHTGHLKQAIGYNAYLVDMSNTKKQPLTFEQWMRGLEEGENK